MSFPQNGTWSLYVNTITPTGNTIQGGNATYYTYNYGSNYGEKVAFNLTISGSDYIVTYEDPSTHEIVNKTYTKIYGQGNYGRSNSVILSNDDNSDSIIIGTNENPVGNSALFVQRKDLDYFYGYPFGSNVYEFRINSSWVNNFDPCFLLGTLIKTPKGEAAVETLCVGDELLTYSEHGEPKVDIVTWVGKAQTFVRQNLSGDEAGYPVRILKDAISDGMPFKDLLITPEHCLFFDGKFIPARMLVNGSSIFYDTSFTSYDYYHIETEKHSVIMADGMLTESYLDTGNRLSFSQNESVSFLNIKTGKTWEKDAAAPLSTARDIVEPIFRQIEARAQDMRRPVVTQPAVLTDDADIHLMTDKSQIIRPSRQNGNRLVFQLPEQTCSVRILSNASRPCDIVGSFLDDRRKLGVLIGEISVFSEKETINLTAHLEEEGLSGWQSIESPSMRWTNGNALLPLDKTGINAPATIAFQVVSSGPYLVSNELEKVKAA